MIKGKTAYLILLIVFLSAVLLRIFSSEDSWVCVGGAWQKHGNPNTEAPSSGCSVADEPIEKFILEGVVENQASSTANLQNEDSQKEIEKNDIVSVENNELINSPFVLKGSAPGYWFFEGSLPVELQDSDNNVIVTTFASALSDWMTTDLVDFKALLEFETTASSGYVVIKKDNPSGLPENDKSIIFPVKFLPQ
jgi:hypothetical protein